MLGEHLNFLYVENINIGINVVSSKTIWQILQKYKAEHVN